MKLKLVPYQLELSEKLFYTNLINRTYQKATVVIKFATLRVNNV